MKGVCDPADIRKVETAQARNPHDLGIGVINLSTGEIRVYPFDETDGFIAANPQLQVMAGHEAAAMMAGFPSGNVRGFVIGVDQATGQWSVANRSHLNLPDGLGHSMAQATFAEVVSAVQAAGVASPVLVP